MLRILLLVWQLYSVTSAKSATLQRLPSVALPCPTLPNVTLPSTPYPSTGLELTLDDPAWGKCALFLRCSLKNYHRAGLGFDDGELTPVITVHAFEPVSLAHCTAVQPLFVPRRQNLVHDVAWWCHEQQKGLLYGMTTDQRGGVTSRCDPLCLQRLPVWRGSD